MPTAASTALRFGRMTAPVEPSPRPAARDRGRPAAASPFDPPRERFVEEAELGRGGMGRVVAATDRALGRTVAIKQALTTDAGALARFEREVRITARLQHPNIVSILDAGRDEAGHPYYVMRKIEGEPLAAQLARAPTLRERLALLPSVLAAADATAHAHARGVIHRDIKPWNILLGPFGETSLIDWGVARELGDESEEGGGEGAASRAAEDGLTTAGSAVGTPGFMSPEQARGEPADRRCDVYALGATLYYLITAKLPQGGQGPTTAVSNAAADRTPAGAIVPEGTPHELIAIMDKSLAARADARYADAGELAADLRRFLTGQLVAAHRYTTRQRLRRFVQRHRIAVAVAVVAVAALASVITVAARNVLAERDAANLARVEATDRVDRELIARAQSLVATDPTTALATLKQLRPESPRWESAAGVALAAVTAGAEQGYRAGAAIALELSPDGRRLLSVGADGRAAVRDLGARRTLISLELGEVSHAAWAGDGAFAYSAGTGITVVEVGTGASRALAAGRVITDLRRWGGALLARTPEGAVAIDAAGGAARVLAADAAAWYVAPGALVVSGAGGDLRWVRGDDAHALARRPVVFSRALTAASTLEGDRLAVETVDGVVEWGLSGGAPVERGRWQLGPDAKQSRVRHLAYLNDTLYASDWNNTWWRLTGPEKELSGLPPAAYVAPIADGLAFATRTGELALFDHDRTKLPHRPMDLIGIAASPRGRWLAAATMTGEILAFDLAALRPETRRTEASGLVTFDDRAVWLVDQVQIVRLDRATGRRIEFPIEPVTEVNVASNGELITLGTLARRLTIWSEQGAPRFVADGVERISHAVGRPGQGDDEIIAIEAGGRITRRSLGDPDAVREIGVVAGAAQLAIGGTGAVALVAAVTPAGVERFDLVARARASLPIRGVRALAFDPSGVLWLTNEAGLWRWDGAAPPRAVVGVDQRAWIYTRAPSGVYTWSSEGVFFQIDGAGRIERRIQTERLRGHPRMSGDRSTAVWLCRGDLCVLDLAAGVTRVYERDRLASDFALDETGRTLVATFPFDGRLGLVSIWTAEPPPPSRWALRPWLDRSTNAELAPASADVLEWR